MVLFPEFPLQAIRQRQWRAGGGRGRGFGGRAAAGAPPSIARGMADRIAAPGGEKAGLAGAYASRPPAGARSKNACARCAGPSRARTASCRAARRRGRGGSRGEGGGGGRKGPARAGEIPWRRLRPACIGKGGAPAGLGRLDPMAAEEFGRCRGKRAAAAGGGAAARRPAGIRCRQGRALHGAPLPKHTRNAAPLRAMAAGGRAPSARPCRSRGRESGPILPLPIPAPPITARNPAPSPTRPGRRTRRGRTAYWRGMLRPCIPSWAALHAALPRAAGPQSRRPARLEKPPRTGRWPARGRSAAAAGRTLASLWRGPPAQQRGLGAPAAGRALPGGADGAKCPAQPAGIRFYSPLFRRRTAHDAQQTRGGGAQDALR